MPDRIRKVNELIGQQVSEIISKTVHFKDGVFITVSKVQSTRDLKKSDVHIGVFPESAQAYVLKTLEHEKRAIQNILSKKLSMRRCPQLNFIYDPTETKADEIEKILIDLHKNNEL